ncbi:MAG: hypothetical protein HKM93_03740 [Desulfobacteraceae bacterium]|nr:hypothetical protein [Desulfobacteraceae bacterium]
MAILNKHLHSRLIFRGVLAVLGIVLLKFTVFAADCSFPISDFTAAPQFLSTNTKPNVLLILDNSGSMLKYAYHEVEGKVSYTVGRRSITATAYTGYIPGKKYYGLFNPDKCYSYENANHYFVEDGDTVDDPSTGIVERAAGFKDTSERKFSGNWLNWWTMRRFDVAKKALTGGKVAPVPYNKTDQTLVLEGELVNAQSSWFNDNRKMFNDYISQSNFSPGDDDTYKDPHNILTGDHQKNVFYTPFRRGIYSYFFTEDRGDHFDGSQKQFVPMFTAVAADFDGVGDLTGTTTVSASGIDLSTSTGAGSDNAGESDPALRYSGYVIALKVKNDDHQVAGIVQELSNKVRFGYMQFEHGSGSNDDEDYTDGNVSKRWDVDGDGTNDFIYQYADGGIVRNFVGDITLSTDVSGRSVMDITKNINEQLTYGNTPLEEVLWEAVRYYQQLPPSFSSSDSPLSFSSHYTTDTTWDPYYFNHLNGTGSGGFVPCAKSYIILVSDGASNNNGWRNISGEWPNGPENNDLTSNGSGELDDIAYSAHVTDLRDDTGMEETSDTIRQNITLYTIFCFDQDPEAKAEMMKAARAGGFEIVGDDLDPGGSTSDSDPAAFVGDPKWDKNNDNIPDTYLEAEDGEQFQEQLLKALTEILGRTGSGTAAAVNASTRRGEGAVYQAIFNTESDTELGSGRKVRWYGTVNALFMDQFGSIREDSDGDKALDLSGDAQDRVIIFDAANDRYNKFTYDIPTKTLTPSGSAAIDEINYLWDASDWLGDPGMSTGVQRPYGTVSRLRYIFTDNINTTNPVGPGNVDSEQIMDFLPTSFGGVTDKNFYFLNPDDENTTTDEQRLDEAGNIVRYIRGEEGLSHTLTGAPYRNRSLDINGDGTIDKVFRLGDIVHSAPTSVSAPAEYYDLLYKDDSYRLFRKKYLNRRNVVYAGANDGMLHAFNGGFIHREKKSGATDTDVVHFKQLPQKWVTDHYEDDTSFSGHELGAELWAYVPNAVLPHLRWLKEMEYSEHVYYVDMKPVVFDANIFSNNTDNDYPGGWGTVLVSGLRFGGPPIGVDTDQADPDDEPCELEFTSTYFALDITNPEKPPKLLWSFTDTGLGLTTSYVTPIRVKDKWFLVIGSGPDNFDAVREDSSGTMVAYGGSGQNARVFVVEADTGTLKKEFVLPDTFAFVSDPVAMDFDLARDESSGSTQWSGEAVYFGTDGAGTHKGRIYRLVTKGSDAPDTDWELKLLFDTNGAGDDDNNQHISISPSIVKDVEGNFWVYFGTGRFWGTTDKTLPYLNYQNSFYGIKEPVNAETGAFTWATVEKSALKNVSCITSEDTSDNPAGDTLSSTCTSSTVTETDGSPGITLEDLDKEIDGKSGWFMDFADDGERNISRATIFGDIILFTTYVPDEDPCEAIGYSYLYGLYYKTGTAYDLGILKSPSNNNTGVDAGGDVIKRLRTGEKGVAWTPKLHVDPSLEGGLKAVIQTSDGPMIEVELENPGIIRSEMTFWNQLDPSQPSGCIVRP